MTAEIEINPKDEDKSSNRGCADTVENLGCAIILIIIVLAIFGTELTSCTIDIIREVKKPACCECRDG